MLISLIFISSMRLIAQSPEMRLKELGFENIELACVSDTMFISVDDPVYRGTFRGAGVALKNLSLLCPNVRNYKLIVKEQNIAKVAIDASVDDGHWTVDVGYDESAICDALSCHVSKSEDPCFYNSSYGKVNVILYPMVSLVNNRTDKLFSYGVSLAPSIETCLWRGNKLVVQPIIPLCNNYDVFDANSSSRFQLGSVTIQQDFINKAKWWCRVYGGFFRYNYVGANLDVGARLNKYIDLSLKASAVRKQEMNDGSLKVGSDDLYSALLIASIYEPRTSMELKLTCGRYLFGDYGCRVDGICRFGEYAIGFYGIYSDKEYNGGFHFSIPFAGKHQKRMGQFSIRIPEYFDWEYSMVTNYEWAYKQCGKSPQPLPARNMSGNYWQAKYIKSYLQRYLDGEVE